APNRGRAVIRSRPGRGSAGPEPPGEVDAGAPVRRVFRVGDLYEGEPVGADDVDVIGALTEVEDRGEPLLVAAAVAHGERGADEAADHRVAERVGPDGRHRDPVGVAGPVVLEQFADRGGSFALLAEADEVVLADQALAGGVHAL